MLGNTFSLKQLEALVWVADLGSFRKAAQRLGTTQPNISSRIAGLEATLGCVLMQRDAGSVRFTEKGSEILLVARKVLREAEALIEVAQRADLLEDRLRLGVTELVACTWLHAYLRALKKAYPRLSVELTVDLSRNLDKELGTHALDLAIQTAPFATAARGVIELGKFPYIWVAARNGPADQPGKYTLDELIPHTVLTHARHTQAYMELTDHADGLGLPTTRFVSSNSLASCVQMAVDGLGVALLPEALVEKELAAGGLVRLDVNWTASPLRFAARYQAERVAGHVAKAAAIASEVVANFYAARP